MTKNKVLIVDDNSFVLKATRLKLESAGYRVVTNDSAVGTPSKILHETPDVVLMDVMMPGLYGDELVSLVTENKVFANKNIKFILFSSLDSKNLDALVAKCGAAGAIKKTDDLDTFLKSFETLLAEN